MLAASWLACRLPEGPLYGFADLVGELWYRLTPERAAQARRNLRRVSRVAGRVRAGQPARCVLPPPTRGRSNDWFAPPFRHAARYYLEVARNPSVTPAFVDERLAARHPGAHRRGRRPGQGRPVRRAPFRLGRDGGHLPRLPGRRDGHADGDDRRRRAAGLLRAHPRRGRDPPGRPARGAARADSTRSATASRSASSATAT